MGLAKTYNKKWVVLFSFLLILFLITSLTEPIFIKNANENWEKNLVIKINDIEDKIHGVFDEKSNSLINYSNQIKTAVKSSIEKKDFKNCFNTLKNFAEHYYNIQINKKCCGRICWYGELFFEDSFFEKVDSKLSQTLFYTSNLKTYLIYVDTLNSGADTFYIVTSVLIEKDYELLNEYFEPISTTNELSKKLGTFVTIEFDEQATKTTDGRKYSFNIRNNFNNKIGAVTFDKPALDNYIKNYEELFASIQSVLILFIYLLSGYWIFRKSKTIQNNFVQFVVIFFYVSILRILLFAFNIPSEYFRGELTNPSNFSSVFAFGIVQSPLELMITLLGLFVIIYTGNKYLLSCLKEKNKEKNNWLKFSLYLAVSLVLFFISLRALGASLRSVVFDSTIRYFKEFALIPSPLIIVMDINILILGLCGVLVNVLLLKIILSNTPSNKTNASRKILLWLFIFFQLIGWIYDALQKQPQGTPIIRIVFITIIFLFAYLSIIREHRDIYYLFYGFAASIISVSLLVYYNSEIERESLKTTAQEITRKNENIYQFILYQTLEKFSNDEKYKNEFESSENYDALAFRLWTESLLYRENIPSTISIHDVNKNLIGKFSVDNRIDDKFFSSIEFEKQKEIHVYKYENIFSSNSSLVGVAPINVDSSKIKYVVISVIYSEGSYNVYNPPKFLSASRLGIASATESENLNIYFFNNRALVSTYGGISLDSLNIKYILEQQLLSQNETWLKLSINDEKYLTYILRYGVNGDTIVIALEEKQFAWNLSNFFKVFFAHSLILLIVFLSIALTHLKRWKIYLHAYRTKLSLAFIVVSVIPLLVVSLYLRNINEENNISLVNNRLNEKAQQIENYLKRYSNISDVDEKLIFEKAATELNINFSVYENDRLVFSSYQNYIDVGLFSNKLSADVFNQCVLSGTKNYFTNQSFDRSDYYSVYYKSYYNGKEIILSVNNIFNNISIPLTKVELDIFLFGVLSLAMILLIVFSTILAKQISSPIRKLTLATRSVGSGDLNIEIVDKSSGEISELTNGFNMMVKKLKKSQIDLAQLEREAAWKEMAKQVAHEIKNPLTPMKLSVQQLITAYRDKSNKFDEIFNKVTTTFINQIETLKNIASEFSNFARMPRLTIERINIVSIIQESINLFVDEKISIDLITKEQEIFINADADQLRRTLINMIRNSLQANAENITITLKANDNNCEITIKDNGGGIEKKYFDKLFEENFTTKPQGMGLGLSMAKKFLLNIGGDIIIVSSDINGTEFLITIPLSEL